MSIVIATPDVIGDGNVLQVDLVDIYYGDSPLGIPIIDVTIVDENGVSLQPQGDIEICIDSNGVDSDNPCLGFFNELNNEWECEDTCLEEDNKGLYCGITSHLSRFTLLLDPGGTTGNERCGSDSWNGITPTPWGDAIVIASACILVFCIGIIVIILITLKPRIHGSEYIRISTLRKRESRMSIQASSQS